MLDKRWALIFHSHFSYYPELPLWEQVKRIVVLCPDFVGYLNKWWSTELILLILVVNIKPKSISDYKIFLLDFHCSLDCFPSLDRFLDNFVYFVEIYPSLSYQVVETNDILVPDLQDEDIRVHIFGFRRVFDFELESIVKAAHCSAGPVNISFLRLRSANHPAHKYIIRFRFHIFIHAVICLPDNNS